MSGAAFELVTARLEQATGYRPPRDTGDWKCPAHDDNRPSLSVSNGSGRVLVHCQSGCELGDVLDRLQLHQRDLFDEPQQPASRERARIVDTYDYVDERGELLFQVVRLDPKGFRQRRPDGNGGWEWSLRGTRRVLYRLPQVLAAVAAGQPVWVVEGEKDVHALERAGEVATCNPQGAANWSKVDPSPLAAADVIVVRDRDPDGVKWAADVEASLVGKAARVRVVDPLPAFKGADVADHLAEGHTLEELQVVSDTAAPADVDDSLQPIDLGPVLDGTSTQPLPTQLQRDDGHALFYAGSVNGIHGDSGTGKGWVVCHLVDQNARHGRRTLLLDLEDTAESIVARLLVLGMSPHTIETYLVYVRPQVPFDELAVDHIVTMVGDRNIGAVVVDSVGEAFALAGVNEDKDVEVGPWLRRVARPLADTGAAIVLVDHSTKAGTNDLHPSGSKRKRAAITGASYLVEAVSPFVKDQGGRLRLTCAKDRHGNYRRGEAVADLVMSTDGRLKLYAPTLPTGDATVPTVLAARAAVAAVKAAGRTVSQNELLGLMKGRLKAGNSIKRGGIDFAVAEGALTETPGPRNGRLFTYAHDLEEHE